MKDNIKVVLFSGGFDSTYMLHDICRHSDPNTKIQIISITATFLHREKESREIEARKRILNYMKAKYYNLEFIEDTINLDFTKSTFKFSAGLFQPLFWISSLVTLLKEDKEHDIIFSYICGDQALSYKEDIKSIVRSSLSINNNDTTANIEFPLEFLDKSVIIGRLIDEDEFLFYNATSCETGESDYCGKCVPCNHTIQALTNIVVSNNINYLFVNKSKYSYIQDICKEYLKNHFGIELNINKKSDNDDCTDCTLEDMKDEGCSGDRK